MFEVPFLIATPRTERFGAYVQERELISEFQKVSSSIHLFSSYVLFLNTDYIIFLREFPFFFIICAYICTFSTQPPNEVISWRGLDENGCEMYK